MIDALTLPFHFPFMQNAFAMGAIIAIPTALLSCFLVLKGWALMGDAVSHAVLPGIVMAYILGLPLIVGAFVAGLGTTLITGYLSDHSRVKQDTVMGVVFSGMFALGLVMFVAIDTDVHLTHILFGNILGVGPDDLRTAGYIAIAVSTLLLLRWKDLLLHAFDPAQAQASGLPVTVLHYGLLILLSATIVMVLTSVGLILSVGLLIAPGAIAFLITRRFTHMMIAAVGINFICLIGGTYLSFFIGSDVGPTIILLLTVVFIVAFAIQSHKMRRITGPAQR